MAEKLPKKLLALSAAVMKQVLCRSWVDVRQKNGFYFIHLSFFCRHAAFELDEDPTSLMSDECDKNCELASSGNNGYDVITSKRD
jgi:hypothetical protein